jgi:adenylate cyclase
MSKDITKSDRRFQGLLAWAAGAVISLILWGTGALDGWEAKTWDWRVQRLAEKGAATDEISLILIDQNSLDWGKETNQWSWPWPREVYSAMIRFCNRSGAKAVAIDMMFLEDSVYGVEDDQQFGQVISEYGAVAGAVFLGHKTGKADQWPEQLPTPQLRIDGLEQWEKSVSSSELRFPKASFPVTEIGSAMTLFGNVHLQPDPDGVYRRFKPFAVFDGHHVPALGLGCWLASASNPSASIAPGRLDLGGHRIPLGPKGDAVLRYRGPSGTHPTYSAAAVIQSEIRILSGEPPSLPVNTFKNKYVVIGASAPGLLDLRTSPVGSVYAGAEVHATLLDNFLSDDFIRLMPGWSICLLLVMLTAVCAAVFFPD